MTENNNKNMRPLADINLTPFVDVMMVLLIIFMITAPLMQQGLDVNLPQAKAPSMERNQEDMIVTIKEDGSIFLGDEKETLSLTSLEQKLSSIYENREKKDLYIKADSQVYYGRIVAIMSIAKAAGVERIGMITRPVSEIVSEEKKKS